MKELIQNNMLSLGLSVFALLLSAYTAFLLHKLNSLKQTFFRGSEGAELEPLLRETAQTLQRLSSEQQQTQEYITKVRQQLGFALQLVGLVRYNPFDDGGGNFSFSIALLDEHKSGIIITSLYGRQQNRMYTKNIYQGKSEITLTEEEEQALKQAIG